MIIKINIVFLWSILAFLHPCNKNHPNRVSNYKQFSNDIKILGFYFTNEFKGSDVHNFNDLKKLSINIFELKFYQDQNKWGHKLIPIEISKNNSDRIIDLALYRNDYILIII